MHDVPQVDIAECEGHAFPSGFELDATARVDEGTRRDILLGGKSPKPKAKAKAKPKAKAEPKAKAAAKRTYVDGSVERNERPIEKSESSPAGLAETPVNAEAVDEIPTPVVARSLNA